MKKFKLTKKSKIVFRVKLFRIKALRDFGNVKKGDFGGWVERENNLSQNGEAWVSGKACVSGKARVYGEARVLAGYLTASIKNLSISLQAQLGVSFIKNKVILYKRVNKITKGKYKSCYDSNFIYKDNTISKVKNADMGNASCSTGIHLSTALYWCSGDTLIACEVNKKDIITIQQGKVRCSKCKVIGEIK